MDDVERMYKHLVRTLRATYPQYLTQPFEVGDLYQTILPYRLHRRELGLETNSDYEHTLLELLSGAGNYLVVDDKMRDVLSAERASGNADTAKIREFASAHVALAPEALAQLDSTAPPRMSSAAPRMSATVEAPAPAAPAGGAASAPPTAVSAQSAAPRRVSRTVTVATSGEACPYCKGDLPAGRSITFCPHCGQDVTIAHCPACGSELEHGWKFCVTCGRGANT